MYRAVFVGRDGVILRTSSDGADGRQGLQFYPGALDALRCLAGSGLHVVVVEPSADLQGVSSQVAEQVYKRTVAVVEASGGQIAHVPHAERSLGEAMPYRKPLAESLRLVAHKQEIDLARSYLVGNTASEVEAARAVGCRACYLVLTGCGRTQLARCWWRGERGFQVAFDLRAAAEAIVERERSAAGPPVAASLREIRVQ